MSRMLPEPRRVALPGRGGPNGPAPSDELRKLAHARLGEKLDLARARHKPLSLLKQEARRLLDGFFEVEVPALGRADRDRLVEEVVGELFGLGPLDELFLDPAVNEVLVLAAGQVIARKGPGDWVPTNVRFRDDAHLRQTLRKAADLGEPVAATAHLTAVADVRLPNGFRAVIVSPPEVMEHPPTAAFARSPVGAAAAAPTPRPATPAAVIAADDEDEPPTLPPATNSGFITFTAATRSPSGNTTTRIPDPVARLKHRVTQRIIESLAAAGVYDLSQFPPLELKRIVAAYVGEMDRDQDLGLDADAQEMITADILAGMRRQ